MEKNILVAIDVGTTKVCTLIAENENDMNMHILGVGVEPMSGMKKRAGHRYSFGAAGGQ